MKPKVTIVVPVYNGANYMKEAIDSALAQTYKNIEIIVVNDGSNDNGEIKKIAESYGKKIRYIEKENGGVSTALNLALKEMTGDYFSWLSHDDRYYPDKVEKEVKEAMKYDNNTIIYSNFDLMDENSNVYLTIKHDHKMLTEKPDYALLRGCISGITLLIPKKAMDKYGPFDVELRCVQDYLKWFEMLETCTFIHMEDVLASSRVHKNQVTNTSPKMVSEGNWLWKHMTKEYPLEKKIKYEGSEYLFYKEMADYLSGEVAYKEAYEEVRKMEKEALQKSKKSLSKKEVTVVIISNGREEDIKTTIESLKLQTHKKVNIIIEGKETINKIPNSKDRNNSLKQIKSDYYAFLNAGVTVKENYLEEMILISISTNKAIVIPNYTNPNRTGTTDNPNTFLVPIDGILFDGKYKEKSMNNLYDYLFAIKEKGGSIATNEIYINNTKEEYDINEVINLLRKVLDNPKSDYQVASLCYDIACIYNKHAKVEQKVAMYEPCDELKEMMYSRSFRMLKQYMDKKKDKKHKKAMENKVK